MLGKLVIIIASAAAKSGCPLYILGKGCICMNRYFLQLLRSNFRFGRM